MTTPVRAPPSEPAAAEPPDRPDVFVSYSRVDAAWVHGTLCPRLEAEGLDVWVDLQDIRGGASDWRATVGGGIEASRAVVFVLSPEALSSQVCRWELDVAVGFNKRLIPVLRREVEDVPDPLARPNWITLREPEDEAHGFPALVAAIATDEARLAEHARLLVRTWDWVRADRDASHLLRGSDLREAERWQGAQSASGEPPTLEQVEFIGASRRLAARRQRTTLAAVAVALLVSIGLGIVALVQRGQAVERAEIARSRELAARALAATRTDPEEGLDLALRAAAVRRTAEGEQALRRAVAATTWEGILRSDDRALHDLDVTADGTRAVTAGAGGAVLWDLRARRRLAALTHAGAVNGVAFDARGDRVVTTSNDRTARIWAAATGRPGPVLRAGALVWSASFDAAGRRVLTRTEGGGTQLWDAVTGRLLARPSTSGDLLAGVGLSPDGTLALTAGRGVARIWSVARREAIAELPSRATLTIATFAPDGRRVLTGDVDGAAQLWDSDGRRIARLPGSDFAVTDAAFSPDGARAVTASEDGSARIWDAATGRRIAVLRHGRTVNGVRFSADGRSVVTAGDDGTARVWPATGGAAIRVLRGHTDSVVAAAFTAGDTRIVTAADDGSARVWAARAPGVTPLAGSGAVESLAAGPDGSRILGMDENGFATIWSTADGRRRASLDGNPSGSYACLRGVGCAPWSADGRFVAGVNWPGVATLWDAGSGREVRRLGGRAATSAAFAPDGRTVAVIWRRNAARLIRAGDGTPAGEPLDSALGLGLQSVQFAAGGRWLQTIDDVDSAALLALAGGRVVDLGLGVLPTAIAVSPDGARVAVGTQLGVVRVLALPSGRPLGEVAAHGAVESVAFDRAGRRLVTAGADRTARVWSARTLTPLAVLREHLDEVKTAAFSPDGRFVLTTSADATAKLWDPALEGSILTLPMRRDGGTAEFTRDGRTIVLTGRTGGEVHRCDVCADFGGLVEARRRHGAAASGGGRRPPRRG